MPSTAPCWGNGITGNLGDGTASYTNPTPRVVQWTPLDEIATGSQHVCGRDRDTMVCWGRDSYGETGRDSTGDPAASVCLNVPCYETPVPVPGLSGVRGIASGVLESCAILQGGEVSCWGLNAHGEIGVPQTGNSTCDGYPCVTSPTHVPGLGDVVQIAISGTAACALRGDGSLWCWGQDTEGLLGQQDAGSDIQGPTQVPGIDDARAVAAGDYDHVCAIRAGGTVWCWGLGNWGQNGQPPSSAQPCPGSGDPLCTLTPTMVPGLTKVRALALGTYHTCALTESDSVYCWGDNSYGELGHDPGLDQRNDAGTTPFSVTPVAVALPPVESITAGSSHTCALLRDSSVRCWGANGAGQIGADASTPQSFVPLPVAGL